MNTKLKSIFKTITLSLGALLLVTTATYAIGTLTPGDTPGEDTQYSLNDIYAKLADFSTATSTGSGLFTIPGTIEESFYTLSDIYGLLEAEESDLVASNIAIGKTIFGVEGSLFEPTDIASTLQWSNGQSTGNWATAVAYCDTLVEGGFTDWRLPTINEYHAITDYTTTFPATDVIGWIDPDNYYWSNTESNADNTLLWDSYYGTTIYSAGASMTKASNAYIRCVRTI